jgi:cell division septum initiation protein DivIVA
MSEGFTGCSSFRHSTLVLSTPMTPARVFDVRPASADATSGFPRELVTEFLQAVESERTKLLAALEEARVRQQRAREVLGLHRVMEGMLLESQREIAARRSAAEAQSRQILEDATRQIAFLRSARVEVDQVRHSPEESRWT